MPYLHRATYQTDHEPGAASDGGDVVGSFSADLPEFARFGWTIVGVDWSPDEADRIGGPGVVEVTFLCPGRSPYDPNATRED